MSRRGQKTTAEDESVYAWAGLMPPGKAAAPITKTYNVATSARSPRDQEKPKMHADSSQVRQAQRPPPTPHACLTKVGLR